MAKVAINGNQSLVDRIRSRIDRKKIWEFVKTLKIELIFAFYAIPGYLCIIALLSLPLDKACRNNLGYSADVCSQLNNGTLKAACGPIQEFQATPVDAMNDTTNALQAVLDQIVVDFNFTSAEAIIVRDICTAETEAQKLQTNINQIRALLGYLGILVIVYAGPIADKYNRKKLFLLLPMLGELINVLAYLTTSVFQAQVPMEFHLIVEKLMYSLSGSLSLMLMGIFAFLAAYTNEENRTFRFGVFTVFNSGLGTVAQQFAYPAYENLGYVNLFILCAIIHFIGCLFIIFCVEELKAVATPIEEPKTGNDNAAYAGSTLELQDRSPGQQQQTAELVNEARTGIKGALLEIVDLFKSNFEIYKVNRIANGRTILFLVTGAYVILLLVAGENEVSFLFGRQSWGWTVEFGDYSAYNTFMSFIGTIVVTVVFVNFFKFNDAVLAIVALTCTLISKPILAFTKRTLMIYTGSTIDMFNSAPAISIRSLLSKIVSPAELGRSYTVLAILEVLVAPVASVLYNNVYEGTIESFAGTFYLVSVAFLAIGIMDFLRINYLFKRFEKATEENAAANAVANRPTNGATPSEDVESHKF